LRQQQARRAAADDADAGFHGIRLLVGVTHDSRAAAPAE
jgi:hypothetical protein